MGADLTDLYLSSLSNRMNEIMRVLTVIATIFMPLSFIVGIYGMNSGNYFDPTGNPISQGEFMANRNKWLPTDADREYLKQIMRPVTEPGKIAAWIAPPARGINGQTVEFEYVRHLPA